MKKYLEILSFYTYMCNKWRSYDYGSWNLRCNRLNFLTFWVIFYPPYNKENKIFLKNKKNTWTWGSHEVPEIWITTEFFVILGHCLPFYPIYNPQKSKFWSLGDIIISNMCTINENHMMSGNNPEEITIQ